MVRWVKGWICRWLGLREQGSLTDVEQRLALMGLQLARIEDHMRHARQSAVIVEAGTDRLLKLVQPRAERLQGARPLTQDWDEVQRQNLRQFEERA